MFTFSILLPLVDPIIQEERVKERTPVLSRTSKSLAWSSRLYLNVSFIPMWTNRKRELTVAVKSIGELHTTLNIYISFMRE